MTNQNTKDLLRTSANRFDLKNDYFTLVSIVRAVENVLNDTDCPIEVIQTIREIQSKAKSVRTVVKERTRKE